MKKPFRFHPMAVVCAMLLLTCSSHAGDISAILDSTNGTSGFAVTDADSNSVWRVDSLGNSLLDGRLIINDTVQAALVIGSSYTNIAIGLGAYAAQQGVAVGTRSDANSDGVAIGHGATGSTWGVAIGYQAQADQLGAGLGFQSKASLHGAAVGYFSDASSTGSVLGSSASAPQQGVAAGYQADGSTEGVAIGYKSDARFRGVAVGYLADGAYTNIAIGPRAHAAFGVNRIAIGNSLTNTQDNSTALRGSLYLDGATGVFTRGTFGSGTWTNLLSLYARTGDVAAAYVRKSGDTMTGSLSVNTNISTSYSANRGNGSRAMLTISGGNDVEIGNGANGYDKGVAVGDVSIGRTEGTALGYQAWGYNASVGIGYFSTATNRNIAIGYGANADGDPYATAIGYGISSRGSNTVALRGNLYLDGGSTILTRPSFGVGGWANLLANYALSADVGSNYVDKSGDTMTGNLAVNTNITALYTADRGSGDRGMLTIDGGDDVEIGNMANGYEYGVAIGRAANGTDKGVGIGYLSLGRNSSVGLGYFTIATNHNIAIGYSANAGDDTFATAIGYDVTSRGSNTVALRGDLYLDGGDRILGRSNFNSGTFITLADGHSLDSASGSFTDSVYVASSGRVRIGAVVTNITADLHIVGSTNLARLLVAPNDAADGEDSEVFLAEDNDGTYGMSFKYDGGLNRFYLNGVSAGTTNGPHWVVERDSGRMGIGTETLSAAYQLSVGGAIRAEEIVVESGWADFVFEDDYVLPPLSEVKAAIERDGRLPGMPSAETVQAEGVSIGDMQTRMLQKIEELTLYTLQQQEAIERLEKEITALRGERRHE